MNVVVMSIRPKHWNDIASGKKTVEYRKRVWKQTDNTPVKILVYATSPIQRVVGEIVVTSILEDSPKQIWLKTATQGAIDEKDFYGYFGQNENSYAIVIDAVKIYEESKSLSSLKSLGVKSAPQSWQYAK
ncbi:ASCH domain-containing protein [Leuconostoc falkenbergense]